MAAPAMLLRVLCVVVVGLLLVPVASAGELSELDWSGQTVVEVAFQGPARLAVDELRYLV